MDSDGSGEVSCCACVMLAFRPDWLFFSRLFCLGFPSFYAPLFLLFLRNLTHFSIAAQVSADELIKAIKLLNVDMCVIVFFFSFANCEVLIN
jgi:hypothetical protein